MIEGVIYEFKKTMVIKSHNKIGKVEANYTPLSPISFLSQPAIPTKAS